MAGLAEMFPIETGTLSIEQDGIPDSGRSGIFEPGNGEIELLLANAMHQFDACNRGCGAPEPLKAKHDLRAGLDVSMVLLGL